MSSAIRPKVTVVTPLFNHAHFLPERVRSILGQTIIHFEWLIIDDCSTDNSFDIARNLTSGDDRVKLLRNSTNKGVAFTTQRAIDMAQGEYIYRAESDDSADPRILGTLSKVLDENPNIGMCYCRGLYMDVDGGVWGGFPKKRSYHRNGLQEFKRLIMGNYIKGPEALIRRYIISNTGGFYSYPVRVSADWHLYLRVCLYSDIAYIGEPLAYYRLHENNLSKFYLQNFNLAEIERETFGLLNDIFEKIVSPRSKLYLLRKDSYKSVAERILVPLQMRLECNGMCAEAEAVKSMIHKHLPDFQPRLKKNLVNMTLHNIIRYLLKLLTYRRVRPMRGGIAL